MSKDTSQDQMTGSERLVVGRKLSGKLCLELNCKYGNRVKPKVDILISLSTSLSSYVCLKNNNRMNGRKETIVYRLPRDMVFKLIEGDLLLSEKNRKSG